MDAALMALAGPIIKFAIGSIVFFVLLLGLLVSQRKRISRNAFRTTMKAATALWLAVGIWFFYWLSKHMNP